METSNEPNIKEWWKTAIVYHILPASFYDSNNDGIGDIRGIILKLDYLVQLGVNALWLTPVYQSPLFDMGYDISNYNEIDQRFGNLNDFKELLNEAHKRKIRIILDLVMNHTSIEHPWFQESKSSLISPKHDWYIWKSGKGKKIPNNWKSVLGGTAWEYSKNTRKYYYHTFFKEQPDLNWRNKDLQQEFFKIVRYWLDLGVDGFRLDAVNMIVKDKKFRNTPGLIAQLVLRKENYITRNRPKSFRIINMLREITDQYNDKLLVGEIYALPPGNPDLVASYLKGRYKGLHLAFDFSLIFNRWSARKYSRSIQASHKSIPITSWPCNVLSNHDLNRPLKNSLFEKRTDSKAKIKAMLLLTLKGTPFIYYGEEIGMRNANIPRRDLVDPLGKRFWPFYKGRDKSRTPMQWDSGPNAGFTKGVSWLPVHKDYLKRNVSYQLDQKNSILSFYQQLIEIRKSNIALQTGEWTPLIQGENNIMAYLRHNEINCALIIINFSKRNRIIELPLFSAANVLISTHRIRSEKIKLHSILIHPYEASLLQIVSC